MTATLHQLMVAYRHGVENLPVQSTGDAAQQILTLLQTRDRIAQQLKETPQAPHIVFAGLLTSDGALKKSAPMVSVVLNAQTFADWRQSFQPKPEAWWWFLDEHAKKMRHPLWTLLSGLFFAASVTIVAETFNLMRTSELNPLSSLGTIFQTFLALVAGSAFTPAGRQWLHELFSLVGIRREFRGISRFWIALGVLTLTIAIRLLLPELTARLYDRQGEQLYQAKVYPKAIEKYQQAISLKPYFIDAHFHLAAAYDRWREFDKAIDEYKDVIALVGSETHQLHPIYNNLARLSILARKDYNGALTWLRLIAKARQQTNEEEMYYLCKNRGWAKIGLQDPNAAADLRQAVAIRPQYAAAHYLLSEALEAQKQPAQAQQERQLFLEKLQQNPEQENEVEPEWIILAQNKSEQYISKNSQ